MAKRPEHPVDVAEMSRVQKAAALLVLLGKDISAEILKKLSDQEVTRIAYEISNLKEVDDSIKTDLINDFFSTTVSTKGGIDFAKDLLEKAKGSKTASKMMDGVGSGFMVEVQSAPFDFLKRVDKTQLISILQEENSQTIALILAHVPADDSAMIISGFPPEIQADVAARIALMDQTTPEMVRHIEMILKSKLESFFQQDISGEIGGVKSLVDILNKVDRNTENAILDSLAQTNPELAEEIKNMMFMFEDIKILDDQAVQRVLKDCETKDLVLALKTSSEEVKSKIFKNMSERAVETLREEMEYTGPVRIQQVEEAQLKIVRIIKNLEAAEEIFIARGGEEEMFV